MFIATLPTTTKTWKHPKCPWTDELTKLYHQHTMENSSVLIKSLPCRPAWMNLEDTELRGYSQSLKDTYYPRSLKWSNSWKQRVGWLLWRWRGGWTGNHSSKGCKLQFTQIWTSPRHLWTVLCPPPSSALCPWKFVKKAGLFSHFLTMIKHLKKCVSGLKDWTHQNLGAWEGDLYCF